MERSLEELVWQRARRRCEYCQMSQEFDEPTFQIDHVIAASHGGPTQALNLALACFHCNSFKGPNLAGTDDRSKKIVALFNPRRHKWERHFRWDGPLLVGKTAAGRATIATLRINLFHRVAQRQVLINEAVFPPSP
jgi:HNH endonuclease